MSKTEIGINLQLNTVEEFFNEPEYNPFDINSRYVSGIDEVVAQMRLRPNDLDKSSRLTIRLPKNAVTPKTLANLKPALNRYCNAKIAENSQVIKELKVNNRQLTISAFVISIVLIITTILLLSFVQIPETISGTIIGFVGIAIWVILWEPIYNYVYAWRPNRLDIKVFTNLLNTNLKVKSVK